MEIGAQLYTLRNYIQTEKDIELSLNKVAEIGYKTVQVSAMGKIDPKKLKGICDGLGLKIVLTHTAPDRIMNETEKVIEEHDILGCKYIGIGMMPEKYRDSVWLPQFTADYMPAAEKTAKSGKLLMYHNHAFEFTKFGGKRVIESLMEDFSPELLGFTLDTYWVQFAGADCLEWIDRLSDRIPCVHLKDMGISADGWKNKMAPVGEGNMNFEAIMQKLELYGNTEYALVEQDTCEESPFVCLEKSFKNIKAMGY